MDIINRKKKMDESEEQLIENQKELDCLSISSALELSEGETVYLMSNIRVEHGFYTVYELKRKFDKKDRQIILDAEFQRYDVWKIDQKRELVESVLIGLPLPIFYFNQNKKGQLIVIDGRQRLTALFQYMSGMFVLDKLSILSDLNGKGFDDLTPIQQSVIEDYQIQAHVILPPTPERVKFEIFERVNRAGTRLNKQEIRNALYQGKATELLERISKSEEFQMATGNALKSDVRMKDKYLILRFISFYLFLNNSIKDDNGNWFEYKNDMDELLAKTMENLNEMKEQEIENIEALVKRTLGKSYFYLGKDAFRLLNKEGKKRAINMNLFETVLYIMLYLPDADDEIIDKVTCKVTMMLQDERFLDTISNNRDSIVKIRTRFHMADAIGRSLMSDKKN